MILPIIASTSNKVSWHIAASADRAVFAFKHGIARHDWHIYKEDGKNLIVGPHSGVSRLVCMLLDPYSDRIHVEVHIRASTTSMLDFECNFQREGLLKKTIAENAWRKTIGICRTLSRTARELGIGSSWTVADLHGMSKMIEELGRGGQLDLSYAARPFDPEEA